MVTTKQPTNGDCLNKPWCVLVMDYDTATEKKGGWSSDFVMEESPGILSVKNKVHNNVIQHATLCVKKRVEIRIYIYICLYWHYNTVEKINPN